MRAYHQQMNTRSTGTPPFSELSDVPFSVIKEAWWQGRNWHLRQCEKAVDGTGRRIDRPQCDVEGVQARKISDDPMQSCTTSIKYHDQRCAFSEPIWTDIYLQAQDLLRRATAVDAKLDSQLIEIASSVAGCRSCPTGEQRMVGDTLAPLLATISDPIEIEFSGREPRALQNGRHRVAAMLDQGIPDGFIVIVQALEC